MRSSLLSFALLIAPLLSGQPVLLPSIGISTLPGNDDPVCTLPLQTPPITSVGRDAGETAADFTLYDRDGNAFNLHDALAAGKPVLMISASYTCPVFRNKVPSINSVVATYGDELTTVIIYTVEAHPDQDISPYFGVVNTGAQNISAGILYRQPTTYGERKDVLDALTLDMQIDAPIYLDGPCNEWWDYYGPQPNNAYLIDTTGVLFAHHDWYDKDPENIICDIDSLLGNPVDCTTTLGGSFTFELTGNDTVYGADATTLTAECLLTNPSTSDVQVRVVRMNMQLPTGWSSSLCMDICYQTDTITAYVTIPAGDEQHFYNYFYSPPSVGTGYVRVGFRNMDDDTNGFNQRLWGINNGPTSTEEHSDAIDAWRLYPDPVTDVFNVQGPQRTDRIRIFDLSGRTVATIAGTNSFVILDREPGGYFALPMLGHELVGPGLRFMKL